MLRLLFVVTFYFTPVYAQEARQQAEPETKARAEKEKSYTDFGLEEANGDYRDIHGRSTHGNSSCIPGKAGTGSVVSVKDVPCECLGVVNAVQEPARQACDDVYAVDRNKKKWYQCYAAIPACSLISDSPQYSELWGARYRMRCQTYCKDKKCQCCDDGSSRKNAAIVGQVPKVVMMVTLQPVPERDFVPASCGRPGIYVVRPPPIGAVMFNAVYRALWIAR